MTRDETKKRQAVIDACRRMNALGINHGTPDQIVFVGLDGSHARNQRASGYGHADA